MADLDFLDSRDSLDFGTPVNHAEPRVALLLAGGEGRRMDYQNKGLVTFKGEALVTHVIRRLMPQVDSLVISANADLEAYRAFGFPVVEDTLAVKGLGPLAGIASALPHLPKRGWLQLASCDGPLIPLNMTERLIQFAEKNNLNAAYPTTGGRDQYGYFVARIEQLHYVNQLLDQRQLRIRGLLEHLGANVCPFDEASDAKAFANCNSADQLQILERE